ncbi:MAG: sugar transferase, partial [Gammaproteobacteria bacterium]|nr:sugar transferase [Gammaproteobacteria bacterium]
MRVLKQYIQLPALMLALLEGVLLILAVYVGAWVRFSGDLSLVGAIYTKPFVFAIVVMVCMFAMGLYQTRAYPEKLNMLLRLGASFSLATVILALLFYVLPGLYLGRGALFITLVAGFLLLTIVRLLLYTLVGENFFRPRVLVYGAGEKAQNLVTVTGSSDIHHSNVVGFIRSGGDIETEMLSSNIIQPSGELVQYAIDNAIDEIVVAIDDRRKGLPVQELLDCRLNGIRVTDALTYFERETGKVKLDLLYPSWMIFSEGFAKNPLQASLSRIFDIVASIILLLITWPLMLLVSLAIVIDDGFPILYRQTRVGFKGKQFDVHKFRSMRVDAEQDGVAKWATRDDVRVTRVGRVIRKFRLDELPQIIN